MRSGLILALLLCGCAHHPRNDVNLNGAINAYYDCAKDAALRLLNNQSTAYEIADAALAECDQAYSHLIQTTRAYLLDRNGSEVGLNAATQRSAEYSRQVVRGKLIDAVVYSRTSPPAQ